MRCFSAVQRFAAMSDRRYSLVDLLPRLRQCFQLVSIQLQNCRLDFAFILEHGGHVLFESRFLLFNAAKSDQGSVPVP